MGFRETPTYCEILNYYLIILKRAPSLRTLRPLTAFKDAPNPNLSKICPDDWLLAFHSWGPKKRSFPDYFLSLALLFLLFWVTLSGTLKNKQSSGQILDNFGFPAFLNAVRGRRVRNPVLWSHLLLLAVNVGSLLIPPHYGYDCDKHFPANPLL